MQSFPLRQQAQAHANRIALTNGTARWTYEDLLASSDRVASALLAGDNDLQERRIGVLLPAGLHYAAAQWGVWRAGGVFVPLSATATEKEISYAITDAEIGCLVTTGESASKIPASAPVRILTVEDAMSATARTDYPGSMLPDGP